MIVIKTQREPTIRILLKLLEEIRYKNLYQHLEYMKQLSEPLPKTKECKK